ncbi:MAG: 3-oxoacid CoA-transferase subunit B [Defluviitaleaceae bacterium]|nr:3-oxoacid CoA-transferase subunit B [Defluviitaleaceae bacterium]
MDKEQLQNTIAKRVAAELKDGQLVNLGIGLPTRVANFIPNNINVTLHSENGFVGMGPAQEPVTDTTITNAGGVPVTINSGGAFFDSAVSFGIIRGGHLDVTVLGSLQVDEGGNIANYMIPGKLVPGMGGAMDLLTGAKQVIVAMEHTAKGAPKILKECNLPLTAKNAVNLIITEMAVIRVTDKGLVLEEILNDYTLEQVQQATEAELITAPDLKQS